MRHRFYIHKKFSKEKQHVCDDLQHGISVKDARDLLINISFQLVVATNQEIGEKFGLTYSSVIQRVRLAKGMFNKELERKMLAY
jgi:hypothetical protein